MSSEKIIVNSWNEWDPLKHVIDGKAEVYRECDLKDYFPKQ